MKKKKQFKHISDEEGSQWLLNKFSTCNVNLKEAIKFLKLMGGSLTLSNLEEQMKKYNIVVTWNEISEYTIVANNAKDARQKLKDILDREVIIDDIWEIK